MAVLEVQHLSAAEWPRTLLSELVLFAQVQIEGGRGVREGDEPGELRTAHASDDLAIVEVGIVRRRAGDDPHRLVAAAGVTDRDLGEAERDLVVEQGELLEIDVGLEVDEGAAEDLANHRRLTRQSRRARARASRCARSRPKPGASRLDRERPWPWEGSPAAGDGTGTSVRAAAG